MQDVSENFPQVGRAVAVEPEAKARPLRRSSPAVSLEKFIDQAMADFESPLIGHAVTILDDLDLAREVVQDTFLRLCQQDIPK
ncbi:MAG: hypothetical protein EOP88_25305, partial [Verrucomicrobiaceae bacterium]